MGSCIMGIQKIEHYNQYQESLCMQDLHVPSTRKVKDKKILKVITHQGGCGHE